MSNYIPINFNSKRLNLNNIINQRTCSLNSCPDLAPSGCCFVNGVLNPNITSEDECSISGTGSYLLCNELRPLETFLPLTSCPSGYTMEFDPFDGLQCRRIAIVNDCSECNPTWGVCDSISNSSFWLENCENCIYVKYEHPIWVTGNVPYDASSCDNSPYNNFSGCDTILTEIFIPKPSSLLTSSTNVYIVGSFDDSISINGDVFGNCQHAETFNINTSLILNPSQSGFMLGAVDSYGVCCHGFLAICFSEIS